MSSGKATLVTRSLREFSSRAEGVTRSLRVWSEQSWVCKSVHQIRQHMNSILIYNLVQSDRACWKDLLAWLQAHTAGREEEDFRPGVKIPLS